MKKWLFIFPLLVVMILLVILSGYRFSALSAAKSNAFLPADAELLEQHDIGSSVIFIFKSDKEKKYRTVLAEKKGIFYRSRISTFTPYSSDILQTFGGISYTTKNDAVSMFSIISYEEEVAYIEAGVEPNRERKEIRIGEPITFIFSFSKQIDHLNPVATNKDGEELYYFGEPENATYTNLNEDIRWHKISGQ
ncbi:hypothetical protein IMZ08_17340 [Bacillus luteolus]|uniref:Uncharacterized protein n=1 Tax=Litchfieldia luteola TaxID=682179 RepID=A0ABR9QMT9_9BACI|nr:hypothetical protein [Cytobacillus luteolus]MBE4909801.1 hypothetical protein [Cytobacillus luteolus]MBP1942653.1 hypothetical protein [Cytobacillus luteolus]